MEAVMDRVAYWVVSAPILAAATTMTLWMAGAIYYDVCGASRWGCPIAVAWVVGVAALFTFWRPLWLPFVALVGTTALFLVWWLRLKPSHDREWEATVSVLPHTSRDGDAITIEGVRNFQYRSLDDFSLRYETRKYRLANLRGVDVIFFNWGVALMSHPVLVFDFGPDGRVCMSIEVRFRKGQTYSILRSFYRRQELIFLAADERDIILRRTKYGPQQEAYLYRLDVKPEEVEAAFLDYVGAINSLWETPRWYHGLTANCTTSFYRLSGSRCKFDWRVLANGRLDRALYADGRLDRRLPFEELKRLARLNDIANTAPADGFGDHVRRELENRRHER
jgi:hypothetical protein